MDPNHYLTTTEESSSRIMGVAFIILEVHDIPSHAVQSSTIDTIVLAKQSPTTTTKTPLELLLKLH